MPSSPRLPSPPPPAEIQLGPNSPSMGPNALQAQQIEQTQIDAAAKRRIHPGTKAADMAAGPPLIPLNELDSAFQLQEHLAALHYYHTRSNTVPITRETAKLLATPPPSIDRTLWLYELCRFLIAQCNSLIVGFLFDTPPCSAATCPEMRASEWQFLCAVHDAPKSCCAIDYCCHTLDWAANVVTNPKIFPSRFVAPLSDGHDKGAALKNLVNVFRRLHRIFAHAWFQHRGVFWSVEGQTGLYVFFKTVCDLYDLLPAENYKLPPEAEGLEAPTAGLEVASGDKKHQASAGGQHQVVTAIARPPSAVERTGAGQGQSSLDDDAFNSAAARTNTRRHIRSNPSTGNAISMVPEVDEDVDGHAAGLAGRMKAMSL
ncbi:Mob1/phocein, partial [Coniochaeta sp. PMI_546]